MKIYLIRHCESEDDILDIGQKIAGLQKYNLGSVNRQDTAEIAAE